LKYAPDETIFNAMPQMRHGFCPGKAGAGVEGHVDNIGKMDDRYVIGAKVADNT
jgi:hypothetical protein